MKLTTGKPHNTAANSYGVAPTWPALAIRRWCGSIALRVCGAAALALIAMLAGANVMGAQQTIPVLPDTQEYDWTRWLEGEWEGWLEDASGNRATMRQSFEFTAQGRYLITRMSQQRGGGTYHGVGVFWYDPGRGQSKGEWFGIIGDRNTGLGRRDGDRWIWDIDRHGQGRERVLRIRERVSDDEYRVVNTTIHEDGSKTVTHETMRRVKR